MTSKVRLKRVILMFSSMNSVVCARSGNVLLASAPDAPHGFTAKIGDFGLSRKMDIQSRIETKTTGTVNYMPPEVLSEGIISKVRRPLSVGIMQIDSN